MSTDTFEQVPIEHWRGESVSAEWLASTSRQYGLSAVKQELVNWLNPRYLIDCFTILKPAHAVPRQVLRNYQLVEESEQFDWLKLAYNYMNVFSCSSVGQGGFCKGLASKIGLE